ncbi:MAG TPA: S4 domain-containing protein, partial [Allocoleopsis sp.]
LLTNLSLDDLPQKERDRQELLALEVTTQFRGQEAALAAQQAARAVAGGKLEQVGEAAEFSLANVTFPVKLFYLLNSAGLCSSSSDARRQIQGGAVRLEGEPIKEVDCTFETAAALEGKLLQVGKRKFVRLVA